MERVMKGEEYYTINICGVIESHVELYMSFDNSCYESGNYFITSEQALAMIEKLKKVLKGADVIEMPSEEDASFESAYLLDLSGHEGDDRTGEG